MCVGHGSPLHDEAEPPLQTVEIGSAQMINSCGAKSPPGLLEKCDM
jgi:hypothetical protein